MSLSIEDNESDVRNKQLTYGSDIKLEQPSIHNNTLNDSVAGSLDKIVKKDSKKRISFLSILSLIISIMACTLYYIILPDPSGTTPLWLVKVAANLWVPTSVIALLFPILAKWHRKSKDYRGRALEITALIIAAFHFNIVFWFITEASDYIYYVVIIICCVLYSKLFNKDEEIPEDKTYDINNEEIPTLFKKRSSKKSTKQRYCKHCGSLIDNATKQCTGCGKQYFRGLRGATSKSTAGKILLGLVSILLFCSVGLSCFLEYNLRILKKNNAKLEEKNITLSEDIKDYKSILDECVEAGTLGIITTDSNEKNYVILKNDYEEYQLFWMQNHNKIDFFDENIVFVLEGYGNYYYTYDQVEQVTQGKNFTYWAYNKEAAIANGYRAWN